MNADQSSRARTARSSLAFDRILGGTVPGAILSWRWSSQKRRARYSRQMERDCVQTLILASHGAVTILTALSVSCPRIPITYSPTPIATGPNLTLSTSTANLLWYNLLAFRQQLMQPYLNLIAS